MNNLEFLQSLQVIVTALRLSRSELITITKRADDATKQWATSELEDIDALIIKYENVARLTKEGLK